MRNFDDDYFDDFFDEDEPGDDDNVNAVTVHEKIGYIYFPPPDLLDKDHLSKEYGKLIETLEMNNIKVHFLHVYPLKERYRFIIEEIFIEDLFDCIGNGITSNFIYEEFYNDIDYFNTCI
jgi:hypothetical protein